MDDYVPHFDCRVYQVDTLKDLLLNIGERVSYTLKNSRMMFAQSYFSQKKLHKLSSSQAVQLVLEKIGIDFYQTVSPDIRLGSILTKKLVDCKKEINIKGEVQTINFQRNFTQVANLSPVEVLGLDLDLEPT
jgi:hypothetical protein